MTFAKIKSFAKAHRLDTVQTIPVCVCGETIYYDFEDPELKRRFPFCGSHRTFCNNPLCAKERYVTRNGKRINARIFYYFPYRYVFDVHLVPNKINVVIQFSAQLSLKMGFKRFSAYLEVLKLGSNQPNLGINRAHLSPI